MFTKNKDNLLTRKPLSPFSPLNRKKSDPSKPGGGGGKGGIFDPGVSPNMSSSGSESTYHLQYILATLEQN